MTIKKLLKNLIIYENFEKKFDKTLWVYENIRKIFGKYSSVRLGDSYRLPTYKIIYNKQENRNECQNASEIST